jgi:hypothetical protein
MMDLEDRLRGTFTNMAGEVPASTNPRAELERRLATRRSDRWRMPALVAAAAVVVAAVVTPVILFKDDGQVGAADQPATSTTEPGTSDGSDPPSTNNANQLPPGGIPLGTYTQDGKTWQALAYLEETQVCVLAVITDHGSESTTPKCRPVPDWPQEPGPTSVVTGIGVMEEELPGSGPLAHLRLFLTAPEVATLNASNDSGGQATVEKAGVTDTGTTLWLADFGAPTVDYAFDASDAAGNIITGGIT